MALAVKAKQFIGGNNYAPGSIKAWRSYKQVYEGFDPLHEYGWAVIDRAFVARSINHLEIHGYMAKVVNKHLTTFKALVNAAYADQIHENQRAGSRHTHTQREPCGHS